MKTKTITLKHLEAALAVPWSPRTCLIAQAFGGPDKIISTTDAFVTFRDRSRIHIEGATRVMELFDAAMDEKACGVDGSANQNMLALRKLLPVTIACGAPQ